MNEDQNQKTDKHHYWQNQIREWQTSNLSQSAFCERSGIKLSTFIYWRGLLMKSENKNINEKFAPLKIIKDRVVNEGAKSIQIKLLTGHVVYLSVEIGITEIAKLIHLLGLPYA